MSALWSDLIHAARQLARYKTLAAPAIFGLAIGIGAATAVFSLYSTLLLNPMGITSLGRLAALWPSDLQHGQQRIEASYNDLLEWRKRATLLEDVALASSVNLDFTLTGDGAAQQVESTIVTGNFFRLLGAQPAAGRLLRDEDDVVNGAARAVISHRLWQSRFGGRRDVIGSQVRSGGDSFTVVGVADPDFDFPRDVDVWLPLRIGWPGVDQDHQIRVFRSVARLKPGVARDQLQAQMTVIARQIADSAPAGSGRFEVQVVPMADEIFGNARVALWTVGGAVLLVLLIACGNAANLLLAQTTIRRQELAVRMALGARRPQLIRLLLFEALLMASTAGFLGLLISNLGVTAIRTLAPPDIPRMDQIAVDGTVLLFGIAATFATVLIFGVVPAWVASRCDPQEALQRAGPRSATGARSQIRMSGALVISEVALSMVLLVGAGLLIRSFGRLAALDPGFNAQGVLTFRVTLAKPDQESRREFYSELLTRLRALPGVESAGAILLRPLSGAVGWDSVYAVEGQSSEDQQRNPNANYEAISPEYFRTMGIQLLTGRDFTPADVHTAAGVVIVNESTADRHWHGESAVGKRIRLGRDARQPWLTVVGVASDVRYREWEAVRPDLYIPYSQRAQHRSDFVVKTKGDPALLTALVQREVMAMDRDQPISNVSTMETLVDRVLARSRFNGAILGSLAVSAAILVLIGIYGVLSYSVAQRRSEIGIRMALGASHGQTMRAILARGLRLTAWGMIAGGVAAWGAGRLVSALLFGVGPTDPLTYLGAALGLLALATLACVVPAIRAAHVDPVRSLRSE